jgi:hypothetical protein
MERSIVTLLIDGHRDAEEQDEPWTQRIASTGCHHR